MFPNCIAERELKLMQIFHMEIVWTQWFLKTTCCWMCFENARATSAYSQAAILIEIAFNWAPWNFSPKNVNAKLVELRMQSAKMPTCKPKSVLCVLPNASYIERFTLWPQKKLKPKIKSFCLVCAVNFAFEDIYFAHLSDHIRIIKIEKKNHKQRMNELVKKWNDQLIKTNW